MLSDEELERYSRQLMLPDFDFAQQQRLKEASVLVLGCGGLGGPLALYLAAAGVGKLVLCDGDRVEKSNLHRQILLSGDDLGELKAEVAARALTANFPLCQVTAFARYPAAHELSALVAGASAVADCSDNYPIRYALNRACISERKPLISAAAVRTEGQLLSFDYHNGSPCYRCLYPAEGRETALSCRDSGVLGPVTGVLGSLQALEVIKILAGWGEGLLGRLLLLDLQSYEQRIVRISRRPDCPDCRPLE